MASKKITELLSIPASGITATDPLPIVSLGASETRKIEVQELAKAVVTLIPDGEIPGSKLDGELDAGAIGTDELADGSVTANKLADQSSAFLFNGIDNRPSVGAFLGQLAVDRDPASTNVWAWDSSAWVSVSQTGVLPDGSVTGIKLAGNSTVLFESTALPASGQYVGQFCYVQSPNLLYVWDGAAWQRFMAAGSVIDISFGAGPVVITVTETDSVGSVQLDTSFEQSTAAAQFYAGPTAAAGDITLRNIVGEDLPTASSSEQGAVIVNGAGLAMNSGQLVIDNDITPVGGYCIATFNQQGLATGTKTIEGSDLPPATSTEPGVVQPSPDDFVVGVGGVVELGTQSPSGGTYPKVTVNEHGIVTAGTNLEQSDIPILDAGQIGSGQFPTDRLADHSVNRFKLSDYSTVFIQEAPPALNDTGHIGMMWFQQSSGSLRIFDGNSWFFVGYSVVEQQNIRFGGLFDADTGLITSLTERGVSSGLKVGEAIPVADATTNGLYVVAEIAGSNVDVTPGQTYTVGDWCLCINETGTGPTWRRIDVTDGTSGGGGGGSSTLDGLTDTIINSPKTGDLLVYNAMTAKWENTAVIDGGDF